MKVTPSTLDAYSSALKHDDEVRNTETYKLPNIDISKCQVYFSSENDYIIFRLKDKDDKNVSLSRDKKGYSRGPLDLSDEDKREILSMVIKKLRANHEIYMKEARDKFKEELLSD